MLRTATAVERDAAQTHRNVVHRRSVLMDAACRAVSRQAVRVIRSVTRLESATSLRFAPPTLTAWRAAYVRAGSAMIRVKTTSTAWVHACVVRMVAAVKARSAWSTLTATRVVSAMRIRSAVLTAVRVMVTATGHWCVVTAVSVRSRRSVRPTTLA